MKQHEAAYYEKTKGDTLRCMLCPQGCVMKDGETGICRTRVNAGGVMKLTNYGIYTSLGVDPVEKKPLYHFHPGKKLLSIGGRGCNLKCAFCQNAHISQGDPQGMPITVEKIVELYRNEGPDCAGVAFTYNEPFIWFEFIRDAAPAIRDAGGKVILVTNGFVNHKPLSEMLPLVDAMNVDLKAFTENFYKKYCSGKLDPVKSTIKTSVEAGVHVEVTLLLIPTLNDNPSEVESHAKWMASVSTDIPLHISRYFPNHKLEIAPTPLRTMIESWNIAEKHLNYVYLGNVGDPEYSDTACSDCGAKIIRRRGYDTDSSGLEGNKCRSCGADNNIIC